ncbi:AraC family transcriptional regulator [Roseibium sp.]|uniref:AraC family transcriptional regulator n=1 Tax=Roseibium sp. TaxID=1936156 RepID=UPI003B50C229
MSANSTRGVRSERVRTDPASDTNTCLERLCTATRDSIRVAPEEGGIERIEARFKGKGFDPHRHDTYAIGLTLNGVQTFRYRGASHASLPGQIIVIHPDELHDGGAGTEGGLHYRMIYVQPEDMREALEGTGTRRLPHLADPVFTDPHLQAILQDCLEDMESEIGDLKRSSFLAEIATGLCRVGDTGSGDTSSMDWASLEECAGFLKECFRDPVRVSDLENIANLDRFTLSRQFKRAYGTSPHRYLLMRRLGHAKQMLANGNPLADAAIESGFADQSHMNRHFRRAFGMTPGAWRRLTATDTAIDLGYGPINEADLAAEMAKSREEA